MIMEAPVRRAIALACLWLVATSAAAQQAADIGFVSVGRAAPLEHDVNKSELVGSAVTRDGQFIGAAPPGKRRRHQAARARPLHDGRLLRGPRAVERPALFPLQQPARPSRTSGPERADADRQNPPAAAPWGHCDRDYPRKSIVSPYLSAPRRRTTKRCSRRPVRAAARPCKRANGAGRMERRLSPAALQPRNDTGSPCSTCRCRRCCRC